MILAILLAAGLTCGVERADVKHLSDAAATRVMFNPQKTSVTQIAALPAPEPPISGHEQRGLPQPGGIFSGPQEFMTYTVDAYVCFTKKETDLDGHIVLTEQPCPKKKILKPSFIVESVDPRCATGSIHLDGITAARNGILAAIGSKAFTTKTLQRLVGKHVRVTGVFFYDALHGQTGVAVSGGELHPLVGFELIP
jgi:hypothetical protein